MRSLCHSAGTKNNDNVKLSKGAATLPTPTPISTAVCTLALHYETLGSFSQDRCKDKVTVYISPEGVDQEKIETDIKPMSFDIKFHDVQGKNYKWVIPKLHNKDIVPEKCRVLVKPKRVVCYLFG